MNRPTFNGESSDASDVGERVLDAMLLRRSKTQRRPGHGSFACPACRSDQPHTLVAVFETTGLLGAILAPRGRLIQMAVECDICGRGFDRTALDRPLFADRPTIEPTPDSLDPLVG